MNIRFLVLFFISFSAFSQVKFEREYRLNTVEVPKKAQDFVTQFNFDKKVKWYAEESNDGKTYEAKVCYNNYKYSLEFSEQGAILDVEKTIKLKELPKNIQDKIKNSLAKRFTKFKIKKVQIQYVGAENEVLKAIKNSRITKENFEIIVKGKTENSYHLYELLLNKNGEVIRALKFKSSNSLNLEF